MNRAQSAVHGNIDRTGGGPGDGDGLAGILGRDSGRNRSARYAPVRRGLVGEMARFWKRPRLGFEVGAQRAPSPSTGAAAKLILTKRRRWGAGSTTLSAQVAGGKYDSGVQMMTLCEPTAGGKRHLLLAKDGWVPDDHRPVERFSMVGIGSIPLYIPYDQFIDPIKDHDDDVVDLRSTTNTILISSSPDGGKDTFCVLSMFADADIDTYSTGPECSCKLLMGRERRKALKGFTFR